MQKILDRAGEAQYTKRTKKTNTHNTIDTRTACGRKEEGELDPFKLQGRETDLRADKGRHAPPDSDGSDAGG